MAVKLRARMVQVAAAEVAYSVCSVFTVELELRRLQTSFSSSTCYRSSCYGGGGGLWSRGEECGALRGSGEASLNRQRVVTLARSELALVGAQVEGEVWASAWDGAVMVRDHNAHGSSLRRGLEWSQTSTQILDRKLCSTVTASGGRHSSGSCVFWTRWRKDCRVARPCG